MQIIIRTFVLRSRTTTKTRLYNFDPLKPHFYIVKLGFTGVHIIFLIYAKKHRLWYSLEPPRRGGSNEYLQSIFWAEIWKILEFFIWKLLDFDGEIFNIFEKACFRYVLWHPMILFTDSEGRNQPAKLLSAYAWKLSFKRGAIWCGHTSYCSPFKKMFWRGNKTWQEKELSGHLYRL